MRGVDVDDVEAGTLGAHCSVFMPAPILTNVVQGHRPGLQRIAILQRRMHRGNRHFTTVKIGGGIAVVGEFHRRQRAMRLDLLAHQRKRGDISVVPQAGFDIRRHIAARVDFTFFGADYRPATLGFDFTHGGMRFRHLVAHAVAVRDLVKAVACSDRADLNRLEQNVITGIAGHEK